MSAVWRSVRSISCSFYHPIVFSHSNDCGGVLVIGDLQISFSICCAGRRNLHSLVEVDLEAN